MTDKGTPALNGKAIRKQVTISFSKDQAWPKIHLLIYLPADATSRCRCSSPSTLARCRVRWTTRASRQRKCGIRGLIRK